MNTLLTSLLTAMLAVATVPQNPWCTKCNKGENHSLNGEVEITSHPNLFDGVCTFTTSCNPTKGCTLTGSIAIKNKIGGATSIRITKPDGSVTDPIGEDDSVNITFNIPPANETEWPCGTQYTLTCLNDAGQTVATIQYTCNLCPSGPG